MFGKTVIANALISAVSAGQSNLDNSFLANLISL
jgi:hypothetical protein